ncbi:MAG: fibronectin type III domain-containing protein [Rhodothermaceae bacterium]|nr:fibronectin type III domain-containing protein [Rhodothermaceae bacterium]
MNRSSTSLFVLVLLAVGMFGCGVEANDPVPSTPQLVAPVNQGSNIQTSLELQWDVSDGADTYSLQVSEDPNFGTNLVDRHGMTGHFFVLRDLEIDKSYYWRVNATNDVGESNWSDTWQFAPKLPATRPTTPGLVLPEDSTQGLTETVLFSWDPVEGATHYHLQVALEPSYLRKVANAELLRDNTMAVRELVDTYIYFWRVRAVNPEGHSAWSKSRIIAVGHTVDWVPIFGPTN